MPKQKTSEEILKEMLAKNRNPLEMQRLKKMIEEQRKKKRQEEIIAMAIKIIENRINLRNKNSL